MALSFTLGLYYPKEEVDKILKEDGWMKVDRFKISDESLKKLKTNTFMEIESLTINTNYDAGKVKDLEIIMKGKGGVDINTDISGCYFREIKENWALYNRYSLLIPNHKDYFPNDYACFSGTSLKKTPFLILGGALAIFSLYKFRKSLPFKMN